MARTNPTQDAAAARASERERINAIMSHDEAADRPKFARFLALETNHSVEVCVGVMAAAGKETVAVASSENATPFTSYMDASAQPDAGGSVGFHDDVIGSLVNLGVIDGSSATGGSDETVALAKRMGLKGFARRD